MIKVEHNVETNEIVEREMTEIELQEYNDYLETIENQIKLAEAKAIDKIALLDRLGITEAEAELLK